MIVTLNNQGFFVDVIGIISELVSEIRMKFSDEGLKIVAIDPTNAAMMSFKIPKDSFSKYEVDGEEKVGINLDDFKQVLKRGRNESLTLETSEGKIIVNFGEKKKNFVLSLLDIDSEERKEPELKFKAVIKINSSKFQEAIEDCSVVSDSVLFKMGEEGFVVDAKSSLNSASVKLINEKSQSVAKSRYSLDYLQKMVKSSKLAENVDIQFSDDYPLKLHYSAPQKAELNFILAPRVETE